jgi:small subunit ribosomal protein S14
MGCDSLLTLAGGNPTLVTRISRDGTPGLRAAITRRHVPSRRCRVPPCRCTVAQPSQSPSPVTFRCGGDGSRSAPADAEREGKGPVTSSVKVTHYSSPESSRMAKKSMIARDVKRRKLVERFAAKRAALMAAFEAAADPMERLDIHRRIQALPRNSAPVRLRNRCWATGKPRGVYRDFGLCRNQLRERAHKGELPGVVKSSW